MHAVISFIIFALILFFIAKIIIAWFNKMLFFISKIGGNKYTGYKNYRKYYRKNKYYKRYRKARKEIIQNIMEQRLSDMNDGIITIKKIINIEETKIFYSILNIFKDYNIYKKVSFKAFLDGEENTDVWKTFRDFYCDFLITHKKGDKTNEPLAVIEYDRTLHLKNNSEEMKEKIKNNYFIKEKLINKAGLKYFIIKEEDIKLNYKFIDDKKLEYYLYNILNSLKNVKQN
ncbi:DUF2726 domain-containing protein [uncultured Brachyspira sp.]|uniref:DUF2726 domain-containing protein n=1 Tax=uncultured Brachyspira sp. TaxID=221953 RepID=UPI0025EB4C67|nr:DUF2726 domain-containing protein [uncultured Brachyspira sp.]